MAKNGIPFTLRTISLAVLFFAAFGALLFIQSKWQLHGAEDPRLVAFLRRYERGDGFRRLPRRGAILARDGTPLAFSSGRGVWEREYPLGAAAAHPVGLFNRRYGITGLERALDERLSRGEDVTLTIDAALQKRAYDLLAGRRGAIVALEPASGRIRALVSSPAFDPASPTENAANSPLYNRAIHGMYPPGSTFKLFIAAAALSRGLNPVYNCPAAGYSPSAGTPPIRDSEVAEAARRGRVWNGWGRIGMEKALAHSSNSYFAHLAVDFGPEAFNAAVFASRLRDRIDVASAGSGALESPGAAIPEAATAPELAQIGIGQGRTLATPLSIALLTAAIADEGAIAAPRLVDDADGRLLARPFSPQAAAAVSAMMREAVKSGTAKDCAIPGLEVCGKTGTAENGSGADHSWFTCFAPAKRPRLVVTVLIENGGFGAKAALPVAKKLLEYALGRVPESPNHH